MPAWYLSGLRNRAATLTAALVTCCLSLVPVTSNAAEDDVLKAPSNSLLGTGSPLRGEILLPPEQAFALQVNQLDETRFVLQWTIKDGYYLYRDKLTITPDDDRVIVGSLPDGEITTDEYFGDVEIYRHKLGVSVSGKDMEGTAELTIDYQGCAENRYCYPPNSQSVRLPF